MEADPDWLTADGVSTSNITATVTKYTKPVSGDRIAFSITSGLGSIRTVSGTSDAKGEARAVYTAGTKIGTIVITAVDTTVGISGTTTIVLKSDAPAKILITVDPDTLPADGISTSDINVTVTDINDNPNQGITVEFNISDGSGELTDIDDVTNVNGEAGAVYVAGTTPGKVTIEVTVTSAIPTQEELDAAQEKVLEVPDFDFF